MINKFLCCSRGIFCYMAEYIYSITRNSNIKLIVADNIEDLNYNNNDIYIFVLSLPEKFIPNTNVLHLNTEQCTIPVKQNYVASLLNNGIRVVDYSLENIQLLNKTNLLHLSYQFDETDINKLKHFVTTIDKTYDVAFVGSRSKKRDYILEKLQENDIKVVIVDSQWGDARDKTIASAKMLLNVHYDDDYNVYESLRCDRWVFAKMLTISEMSINNNALDINKLVIFENYDKLVETVIKISSDYEVHYNEFLTVYDESIDAIRRQRLMNLKHFDAVLSIDKNVFKKLDIIQLKYGYCQKTIDIIGYKSLFLNGNSITIPKNLHLNYMFGDPCEFVKKYIYISALFDDTIYKYQISECNGTVEDDFVIDTKIMEHIALINKIRVKL